MFGQHPLYAFNTLICVLQTLTIKAHQLQVVNGTNTQYLVVLLYLRKKKHKNRYLNNYSGGLFGCSILKYCSQPNVAQSNLTSITSNVYVQAILTVQFSYHDTSLQKSPLRKRAKLLGKGFDHQNVKHNILTSLKSVSKVSVRVVYERTKTMIKQHQFVMAVRRGEISY